MDINIYNYLRINPVDMIMVLISTTLIVLIAKKYFWNILQDYLAKRQAYIQSQLDAAKQGHEESEELKLQAKKQLDELRSQSAAMLETAREQADEEARTIVAKAKDSAAALKAKAERDIQQEKREMVSQMKKEMSDIAFEAARKVVEKEIDEKVHKQYVQDFIDEAGDDSWQA